MLQSRDHEKNKQTTNNNNQPQRGLQIKHPWLNVEHDKNKEQTTTIILTVGKLTRSNNKQQQSTPSWGHGYPLCNQSFQPVGRQLPGTFIVTLLWLLTFLSACWWKDGEDICQVSLRIFCVLTHVCSTSSSYIMYVVALTECHVLNNDGTYLADC